MRPCLFLIPALVVGPASAQSIYESQLGTMQVQHRQQNSQRLWHDHITGQLRRDALNAMPDGPGSDDVVDAEIEKLEAETRRIEAGNIALNDLSETMGARNQAIFDAIVGGNLPGTPAPSGGAFDAMLSDYLGPGEGGGLDPAISDFLNGGTSGSGGDAELDFYENLLNRYP